MDLVEALEATTGVIGVVGAGGKKSTMYRLAAAIDRAVVTATVRIPLFDGNVAEVVVTEEPLTALDAAGIDAWPLGLVPTREPDREDRYLGYDPETVDAIAGHEAVETVLVKADGARMRKFKAPGKDEPQLPSSTTVAVPVVSAHVIGEPLSEDYVHRVGRVSDLTGLCPGQIMTPEAVATVITSEAGGRKGVPTGASVIPVINMVDDAALTQRARGVATHVVEHPSIDRVVLTQLTADDPVVEVVE